MRRNGPTNSPIRTEADVTTTTCGQPADARSNRSNRTNRADSSSGRRLGVSGAAFGLAAILCIGTPVAAFAQGTEPDSERPSVIVTDETTPPASSSTPAAVTESPAPTDTAAAPTPAPSAIPAPATPTAPAPAAPTAPAPTAPAAIAPQAAQKGLGGFTNLQATNDQVTVVANHNARYKWSDLLANDVNPNGQPILLTTWTNPSTGTADFSTAGSFLYTPPQGFVGKATITYSIHDVYGNTNSVPGFITINVTPNVSPVAVHDVFTVPAGKPFTAPAKALLANDSDAEGDTLKVLPTVVLGPDHGTAVLNANGDGGFTYTPQAGYTGFDSFYYRITDGHGGTSSLASIELNVSNKFVTVKPSINGNAKVGSTLQIMVGTWSPSPTTYQYQWFRDGNPIANATAKTYVPTASDIGYSLRGMVIGSKAGFPTEQLYTAGTAAVVAGSFTTTPLPTLSGTAQVGSTITAKPGTWVPTPTKTSYYWKANGVPIASADISKNTYLLTAAEIGKKISVTLYVEKPGYGANHTDSLFTGVVAAKTFTSTPAPTVTGTAKVGSALTAHSTAWTPAATTVAYQWKRSGVVITGATAATYTLTAADLGKTVTVVATGKRSGYTSVSKSSTATATIAAGSLTESPTPTITGTTKVGSTLTAKAGNWKPLPVTLTYQWKRNGVAITCASASTYKLTAADATTKLTVTVKGTKSGYTSITRTSTATAAITK